MAEDTPTPTQLDELRRQNADLGARLDALERRATPTPPASGGGGQLRLIDLSLDLLAVAGASTAKDEEIPHLEGGGHDPQVRGFTMQGAELSFAGAVDPYFTLNANMVGLVDPNTGASSFEVEEAYFTTTSLPYALQVKGGQYLTEFGRINPTHPHAWAFIDQPVICTRLFGGDGQRGVGTRVNWSLPTPWLAEVLVGVQNAHAETMPSFLGNPDDGTVIAGRPRVAREVHDLSDAMVNARWMNACDVSDNTMMKFGFSAATGPNGAGASTSTLLAGVDVALKWKPPGGEQGWPFVTVEGEWMERAYQVDAAVDPAGSATNPGPTDLAYPAATLYDRGGYAQVVWGFTLGWRAGFRVERATGSGESFGGRENDPLRDDRTRLSPLIGYAPSEFAHFKLQYDYDRADHLGKPVHSVWLGVEMLIGTHPAHLF